MAEAVPLTPVVIVGCQRSGTTLLRTILGRHPALLEHPDEPQYFYWLYQRFGHEITDVETAVSYLSQHPYLPANIPPERLEAYFRPYSRLSLQEFAKLYLQVWGEDELQDKRPILKDPAWIYHLDLVQELFPGAVIIHIIRDPRANVSSQVSRWPQISVWEAAMAWRQAMRQSHAWKETSPAPYVEVTYKNLLQTPKETLQYLCRALDLEFVPTMLDFEQKTTLYAPNSQPRQVKYRTLDPSRLYQWREQLSPADIRLVELACQHEMAWLNYEPLNPSVPKSELFRRQVREVPHYYYKKAGRSVKAYGRKLSWKLGFGNLPLPQN